MLRPPEPTRRREDETVAEWQRRLTNGQKSQLAPWSKAHGWPPHQLRRTCAGRVRKEFGLEAAQILLGNAKANVMQAYAERDTNRTVTVAAKFG